ncbi:hypothetical protein AB0D10_09475 [Kitasatospora sp. NPDC048545]
MVEILTAAVLLFGLVREFRDQRLTALLWVLPLIPIAVGALQDDLIDQHRSGASIGLGAAITGVGLVLGVAYGALLPLTRDAAGYAVFKGGLYAVAVWAGLLVSRTAFFKVGQNQDIRTGFGFLAISFGAMLLARTLVVTVRSRKRVPAGSAA